MSLARRLILLMLPVPAFFAAANFWWLMHQQATLLREQEAQRARILAVSLASTCTLAPDQMQASLNALFVERDILTLEVIGPDGRYLAHHDPSLTGTASGPLADDPARLTAEAEGQKLRVRLGLSLAGLHALIAEQERQFLGLSLGLLGFATLGLVTLAYRFVGPLRALAATARAITGGAVDVPVQLARTYELKVLGQAFLDLSGKLRKALAEEEERHRRLQVQVADLLEYQRSVAAGELDRPVPAHDELASAFEAMAAALRGQREAERASAAWLAEMNAMLQETHNLLRETDRYRTEFLSVVSHELRTPLTSVKAFAEILLDEPPDEPEQRAEFVGIIYGESDRLTRIINHLLDISRIEAGRMRFVAEEFDLVPELAPCRVKGDREKLTESVEALLKNAHHHGTEVKVAVTREPGFWRLTVEDDGPGVPPDQHELIFSKFQQVRVGVPQPRGTGLSLALARAVVEAQGGTLHVESDGKKGSVFVMRVPCGGEGDA